MTVVSLWLELREKADKEHFGGVKKKKGKQNLLQTKPSSVIRIIKAIYYKITASQILSTS